jgi:Holliday junction resolvase
MPAVQTVNPQNANSPTFESVWAGFQEFREGMIELRESQKETDQIVKEVGRKQEETARIVEENARQMTLQMEENARQMNEYNKRFGDFTRRFGEVVEYMIAPNLLKKFREYGFKFLEAMSNRVFSDDDNNALFEVDVFLQNGEKAMLVEVKTKLTTEDVKEHVERLENMRAYADLHSDRRTFLGAVAGVVMTPHVKKYALGRGFYVIEPSGETFNITPPNGQPKEW